MSQHYSDPARENDPHALPDVEVFYVSGVRPVRVREDAPFQDHEPGWYWWPCLPGCLPDGDPSGPFASEAEALADARGGAS